MKEHPILFNGSMVRAILDGRKTQTRRVMKCFDRGGHVDFGYYPERSTTCDWPSYEDPYGDWHPFACPYGEPGDQLWVRETWKEISRSWYRSAPDTDYVVIGYRATCDMGRLGLSSRDFTVPHGTAACVNTPSHRWRPSIHMPRWASRILLEVVDVRVERVRDISEQDAIAEGVERLFTAEQCEDMTPPIDHRTFGWKNYFWHGGDAPTSIVDSWEHQYSNYQSARGSFASLWEFIHGTGSYAENRWVWVVEFKRVTP